MIRLSFKNIFKIFKTAFKEWNSKDPFRESAVIAYYSIFSLPGLLVVIITLAGMVFGRDVVNDHVAAQIASTLGEETAEQIQKMIIRASETKKTIWATIIGVITILIGATGVFSQFQKSLNIIWEVKADPNKSGIWKLIRVRLFSFGLVIAIAFILIVSLVVSTTLAALGDWLNSQFSETFVVVLQIINYIISLLILSFLFAMMFKFFPDAKIAWKNVWIGSVVTALLFEIGKSGLSLYFGKANPGTGYGAAGSIILILLWVSYSSMIVFYGAEFTRAYSNRKTGKAPPTDIARADPNRKV
jgi:membrane protein